MISFVAFFVAASGFQATLLEMYSGFNGTLFATFVGAVALHPALVGVGEGKFPDKRH